MVDNDPHPSADPDLAGVASAFADPRRIRVLMALCDGRALPAGRLAAEAGVSASTVSNHLSVLLKQSLVDVEQHGRNRYYRLATPHVEAVLEALAGLAPQRPITSLRQHTRARALRTGRTCYRHLAGRLGVDLFRSMLTRGWIIGGDGRFHPDTGDRLSAPGSSTDYRLTADGADQLAEFGLPQRLLRPGVALTYCVDWTEQAHHLSGPLGTAIATTMFDAGWIVRGTTPRSVVATPLGERRLADL
ncbi:ArsR/SmtB family transcription factor [Jongsikchunia kroppenstedtii]|uniref:ArsR/SmtB family transcription factor n=1 Tax=Jongsikchunia kroppenstedtii TaxID=1121721 RepID=UPI0003712303|nr:metalloregulator ArsR/SmtB family transcription factor [Jongsikchunia kroppenstedtii]